MPLLGAGQTHRKGHYAEAIKKGLDFLINTQQRDGDWSDQGITRMYSHGIASIVLCEAYAMSHDPNLQRRRQRPLNTLS